MIDNIPQLQSKIRRLEKENDGLKYHFAKLLRKVYESGSSSHLEISFQDQDPFPFPDLISLGELDGMFGAAGKPGGMTFEVNQT